VLTEASVPLPEQIDAAREGLPELSPEAQRRYAPILRHLESIDGDRLFALVVDRTIVGVADLAEG